MRITMHQAPPIAKRYATAFLNVLGATLSRASIGNIEELASFMMNHRSAFFYVQLSSMDRQVKEQILLRLFERFSVKNELTPLVKLLAQHKRLFLMPVILVALVQSYLERHNIMRVTINSSHELSEEKVAALTMFLHDISDKKIETQIEIDPALIAGIRMMSTTLLWEQSIAQQLRAMEHLAKGY